VKSRILLRSSLVAAALFLMIAEGCAPCVPGPSAGLFDWGRNVHRVGAQPTSTEMDLVPFDRIVHESINESSGLVYFQNAYWTHNDSGDSPRLFRSPDPSFAEATVLTVPGAEAIDWEDITTYRDDLLICDVGDNRRKRESVTLYRVRPTSSDQLLLLDTYRIAYPDGRHDAEACFSVGDSFYIVSKDRGEGTHVYRWSSLRSDTKAIQTGERIGTLKLAPFEQITAADYHASANRVCLLSYSALLSYPLDGLTGAPAQTMRIWARQAESLCLAGEDLIFGNEQRDLFRISGTSEHSSSMPSAALPPMVSVGWPGSSWQRLPLQSSLADEHLEWRRSDGGWELRGSIRFTGELERSDIAEMSLGSGVCFSFAPARDEMPVRGVGDETHLVVVQGDAGAELWRVWLWRPDSPKFRARRIGTGSDRIDGDRWSFEIVVPVVELRSLADQGACRFDVHGLGLRGDGNEVYLRSPGRYALQRPYAWGRIE